MIQSPFNTKWANRLALLSVSSLAVSVNFGVALVSLSSLFIVIAVITIYSLKANYANQTDSIIRPRQTVYAVCLALIWLVATLIWTESTTQAALIQIMRYFRI